MKKLEKVLIYALIFLLPTQLGHFFFIPSSYINGIRIDYLAPAVYLTDILILLIFMDISVLKKISFRYFLISIFVLTLNIAFSLNPAVSLYKAIKILELIFLFYLFYKTKLHIGTLLKILLLSSLFQLLLALLQISTQGSLQGLFYFFGERYFTISTPGIAKVHFQGLEILRPYGTFSHPNSLAGFFLLLYTFVLFKVQGYKLLKIGLLTVTSILIFISFSKIAIIAYGLINIMYAVTITKKACTFCMYARIIVYVVLVGVFFSFQGDPESIQKRLLLIQNALEIIKNYPFFGVGLGSYLVAQSTFPIPYSYYFLQPVHNIFFLFIAEIGIILSSIVFYYLFRFIYKQRNNKTFVACFFILFFTGFFDHYWLTLQQNILLIPIILGLLMNKDMIK